MLADFGLRRWTEDENWDLVGMALVPYLTLMIFAGLGFERRGAPWMSRPAFVGAAALGMTILFLLALDGELFRHLGLALDALEPSEVSSSTLLETMVAMSLAGGLCYALGGRLESGSHADRQPAAWLLVVASPLAVLTPVTVLVGTAEYSARFDWLYLAMAAAIALASVVRERRSFYFAGMLHAGLALHLITGHREWWDRPLWGVAVIVAGLFARSISPSLFFTFTK